MSTTPGMSRRIKDALVSVLSTIQYGGENAFVQVLDNTKGEFDGYPSVRILPSQTTSAELDSADRDHMVEFAVIMHLQLSTATDIESDTYNRMYDLTDLIINGIEHADQIGRLSQLDPTIQSWLLNVPATRWYVGESKAGALLLCNITVQCRYSQLVT